MTLALGTSIDGRYRVERLIGEGGMGAVYAVRDSAGAELALKVVLDGKNALMCKRFGREAELARQLSSEHATRVFDTGWLEDGRPFMVMELLQGHDLHHQLEEHGALSPDDAIDVVVQVCDALGEAHELGMVHRDVKPANIFVRRRRDGRLRAKLLDFGVSKIALTDVAPVTQLTQAGTVLGSPHYMSPEQMVSSSDVDRRADIWSLGATLHELVTGAGPFSGGTVAEVVSAVLRDPPHAICVTHPHVPPALEQAVFRCLEKDPELRYPNVAELVHDLEAIGSQRPAPPPPRVRERPVASSPVASVAQVSVWWRPRWWWGLALFVVLGVVLTLWSFSGEEPVVTPNSWVPDDEWIVGADVDLEPALQERVLTAVKSAQGKLIAKRYDAAALLAADAEGMLVAEGITPEKRQSRLAQYAALIQARVHADQAKALVQSAAKDDDPGDIIAGVRDHLRRESEHVARAAAWDRDPRRCITLAPAMTQTEVLTAWRAYMARMTATHRRVAENWRRSLDLGARAAYDELLHPSSSLSEPCRKAAEKQKRALTQP